MSTGRSADRSGRRLFLRQGTGVDHHAEAGPVRKGSPGARAAHREPERTADLNRETGAGAPAALGDRWPSCFEAQARLF